MENKKGSLLLLSIAAIGLLFGGYFAIEEWFIEPSFATNDAMIWTLPLVSYIFLALTSTGISILLTGGELIGNQVIKAHKSILLITALSLLIGAFASLATELGSFLNVFWLLITPNPTSPIWWMGTLYSIELGLLGIKLFALLSGRKFSFDRWLSVGTLVIAVSASLVLGSVFGTAISRVGYYGMDASVLTFTFALASGLCVAPLLLTSDKRDVLVLPGRIVLALLAMLLVVKAVYLTRSSIPAEMQWLSLLVPFALAVSAVLYKSSPQLCALIALPTILYTELAFVIQGQVQALGPKQTWFDTTQAYMPNIAEVGVFIFGCSVAYLCFYVLRAFAPSNSEEKEAIA
ncbi:hypothetical protein [Vibrio sp. HN007]|uniref:hypothetical protein n=1 Tax=Vibrio iocasae TaxID=3098914 RepID=UPI0035D4BDD1